MKLNENFTKDSQSIGLSNKNNRDSISPSVLDL
jgi:hypothetical protein